MLANVQQTTIQPIIKAVVAKGALIHTDEYKVYARLPAWGYQHKTVCHGHGEYEHTGRYPSQTAANAARKSNGNRSRSPPVPARVRSSGDQRVGGEWACRRGVPRRYTDASAGQRNRPLPRFAAPADEQAVAPGHSGPGSSRRVGRTDDPGCDRRASYR